MFKKSIGLIFSVLYSLCSFDLQAHPTTTQASPALAKGINWTTNYADAQRKSMEGAKPILILFTGTNWCPACMKLEREVLTNPRFANGVANSFVFMKAEFTDPSDAAITRSPYKQLLDRYNIEAFPSIVVTDAQGIQLFTVDYQEGGPDVYVRDLTKKLAAVPGVKQP